MKYNRRNFIKHGGLATLGAVSLPYGDPHKLSNIRKAVLSVDHLSASEVACNEEFWYQVQKSFKQSSHFTNLENGYFCCQPLEVMEAQMNNIRMINERPSHYMRTQQHEDRQNIKNQLAELAGCSHEEIVVTRNTTESLNTIIAGMDFQPGEEAILCDQDYGSMQEQFEMQSKRKGLVLTWIELPLHPESDEEIVRRYKAAITPKTKVMLVTHVINISGQVLPVKKIADMAHKYGVEVICDGAHSFAQIDFKIPDLGCDYFGASLHKWLCCPLGSGLMYIKKDHIHKIWPLYGDVHKKADDIRKFEHYGTHPCSTDRTIADAIHYHHMIGPERKMERLRYLRNYWIEQVKDLPKVKINSPLDWERSCAIGNVAVEGMTPQELATYFFDEHRIFTVAVNRKSVKGVRVTPHLYTTLRDLDKLVKAIKQLC